MGNKKKSFIKVWTIHIENFDQKMNFYVTLMKLRFEFLFTDLTQHFQIYWWSLHQRFLFTSAWGKKWKDCSETFIETKIKYESAIWSHYKHHNTAEFVVCVFSNSLISLAQLYDVRQRFKSFWWMCSWLCTSVPSGRIVYLFFMRGQ